ncbi:MAG: 16S rRNA (cytosine(1402)-N(4))-methyltransferase RsmH [Actinomycetota bacterium]
MSPDEQPVTGAGDLGFEHDPVMLDEILEIFDATPAGIYVDATLGGAGHACAVLDRRPDLALIGIDRDPIAREAAAKRLERFGSRANVAAGRFDEIGALVASTKRTHSIDDEVTAVLFDLGVSSPQLDDGDRGFSYRHDAPLDMRMNPDDPITAAEIVNEWSHEELTHAIRDGGDERFASRIAARIIDHRPISTTTELAEVVVNAIPAATRRTGGHPAKRTFQALRIAVNDELSQIPVALRDAIDLLAPRGRCAVLSYHSGEDRLVKRTIGEAEAGNCTCPPRLPCVCGAEATVRIIPPRQRTASDEEKARNPRSTSARLRSFERLAPAGGSR